MSSFAHSPRSRVAFSTPDPAEDLRRQRDELDRRIAAIELIGVDDYDDGAILVWTRTFSELRNLPETGTYTYAALKAGGYWYLTGREANRLAWRTLVERHLLEADGLWYVSELSPVE